MAGPLTTRAALAVWVGEIPTDRQAFADDVILQASDAVCEAAQHPEWTIDTAPNTAKRIAFQVAKRTYQNPDGILSETTGPLAERVTDAQASGVMLTAAEKEELEQFWTIPPDVAAQGTLWVQPTDASPLADDGLIYLATPEGTPLLYGDTSDPITTIALTPDATP